MKNKYLLFYLSFIFIVLASCGKEGLQGPEGPAGPQGPAGANGTSGAAGAVGPSGQDGSIMYSGTGTPSVATGKTGDYYLDRSTGKLYGPKAANSWGTPISLIGPAGQNGSTGATGAAGTPGSKILSGNGAPSQALGAFGDYYLDKTNLQLYGPKNTSWGAPVLLRGAQGPQGPVGPSGADGSIIYSGNGAPAAALGKNGDYYFDKSFSALYGPKTNAGWGTRTILTGQTGATGATGGTGSTGAAGADGNTILSGNGVPANSLGKVGDFYLDISTYMLYGPKTATNWGARVLLKGAQGPQGPVGPAGADGSTIYSGNGTPDPLLGNTGDYYFNKTNRSLYGPKTLSGWGSPTSLVGATGNTGNTGGTGANGADGNTILSGLGAPDLTTGKNGDFYLDRRTYLLYGPKNVDGWGRGVALIVAASGGGPTVTAFETADDTFLFWNIAPGPISTNGPPTAFVLRQQKANGDTSGMFKLPDTAKNIVNNGVVLVYLHIRGADTSISKWIPVSYTNAIASNNVQYYTFKTITSASGVFVQIRADISNTSGTASPLLDIDKVRVVIVPHSAAGELGTIKHTSLPRAMQQFHLTNKNFNKIR